MKRPRSVEIIVGDQNAASRTFRFGRQAKPGRVYMQVLNQRKKQKRAKQQAKVQAQQQSQAERS